MILITGKIPYAESLVDWLSNQVPEKVAYESNIEKACMAYPQTEIMIGSGFNRFSAEHLKRLPELVWYHTLSAGVNSLPLAEFQQHGVRLTNCKGIHAIPMSEHILGMMLMFSRNLCAYVRNQMEQEWSRDYPKLGELHGKTLCVVGAGSIGRAVAKRAKAFGMHTVGVKRVAEPVPGFDTVVASRNLNDVLPDSDYVVVLTPLTDETFHLFGAAQFARMKTSAFFLNFARGQVVDEPALVRALLDNKIGGAGLDVFDKEPLPANNPLWRMDNVILSPHVAGTSGLYNDRAFQKFVENYRAREEAKPMPTLVNLDLGY